MGAHMPQVPPALAAGQQVHHAPSCLTRATARDTARMAFAPYLPLLGVPSSSIIALSMSSCLVGSMPCGRKAWKGRVDACHVCTTYFKGPTREEGGDGGGVRVRDRATSADSPQWLGPGTHSRSSRQ